MVEVYKRGGSIEACMLWLFLVKLWVYDTLSVERGAISKNMFLEFES